MQMGMPYPQFPGERQHPVVIEQFWALRNDALFHKGLQGVWENDGIRLANPLQSSRSTFSWRSFLSFFAFQAGIWSTPISALLSSPTVSDRLSAQRRSASLLSTSHPGISQNTRSMRVLCAVPQSITRDRVSVKIVPSSSRLCTIICPACAVMISRTM